MIKVDMLDENLQACALHPKAAPIVRVNVTINGTRVLSHGMGLIDTGARTSYIDPKNIGVEEPELRLPNTTTAGTHIAGAFQNAQIEIIGLNPLVPLTLVVTPISRADLLIGRDVLKHFRLVYDTPAAIFTLEEPPSRKP